MKHAPCRAAAFSQRYTLQFLKFLLGLRGPKTSVSTAEHALLEKLAAGRQCLVEVGVYEGASSRVLLKAMHPRGQLFLVDPYEPTVRLERLFNLSFTQIVSLRAIASNEGRWTLMRQRSVDAAREFPIEYKADLIFIDAAHDYESVHEDFIAWREHLSPSGLIAFHDSRRCARRPELNGNVGPVRLLDEIRMGRHGSWEIIEEIESLTVISLLAKSA